jgi:hypothetical protein
MDGYMENLQSISIAQIMLRCKISNQFFTLPVMRAICEAQTLGVQSFRATGTITEAQMDGWGLISVPALQE